MKRHREARYIRYMRPTFGYTVSVTLAAQMLALAYVIAFRTKDAPIVIAAMQPLAAIWTAGLSVLGVYVYKRSTDKTLPYAQEDAPGDNDR